MSHLELVDDHPDLFSYASLSREVEASAREDAALIKAHMKSAADSIIQVGLALKRQKDRLPHGMFLPWIEAEFEMGKVTAHRFMQVAERFDDKSFTVKHLNATALYELAAPSTPEAVRTAVEELLVDGEKVTVADIKRMKADAKAAESTASALSTRNSELSKEALTIKSRNADELEAIRLEAQEQAEREVAAEIESLKRAAEAAQQQLALLRAEAPVVAQSPSKSTPTDVVTGPGPESPRAADNVITPNFGTTKSVIEDEVDESDPGDEYGAIDAFVGSIGQAHHLRFDPKKFWAHQGNKEHKQMALKAVLNVGAMCTLLLKEYHQ